MLITLSLPGIVNIDTIIEYTILPVLNIYMYTVLLCKSTSSEEISHIWLCCLKNIKNKCCGMSLDTESAALKWTGLESSYAITFSFGQILFEK